MRSARAVREPAFGGPGFAAVPVLAVAILLAVGPLRIDDSVRMERASGIVRRRLSTR